MGWLFANCFCISRAVAPRVRGHGIRDECVMCGRGGTGWRRKRAQPRAHGKLDLAAKWLCNRARARSAAASAELMAKNHRRVPEFRFGGAKNRGDTGESIRALFVRAAPLRALRPRQRAAHHARPRFFLFAHLSFIGSFLSW